MKMNGVSDILWCYPGYLFTSLGVILCRQRCLLYQYKLDDEAASQNPASHQWMNKKPVRCVLLPCVDINAGFKPLNLFGQAASTPNIS